MRVVGCDEEEVRLEREPGGRPVLADMPGWHLGISHTRDVVAVAVTSAGPVGVDIEPIRELPAAALARHWFAEREARWIERRPRDFLHLWTQKEAVGKALGLGLRQGGLRRRMPLPPALGAPQAVPGLPSMRVASRVHGDLVLAVACESEQAPGPAEIRTCPAL